MVGTTEYGPVPHPSTDDGQVSGPVVVTSVGEYERFYGGITNRSTPCRLALAARAFFANGGKHLYVQRVFVPTTVGAGRGPDDDLARIDLPLGADDPVVRWEARWPGAAGSRIRVVSRFRRSDNIQVGGQLPGLLPGSVVETAALVAGQPPALAEDHAPANLQVVTEVDGVLALRDEAGAVTAPTPGQAAFHVTVDVEVHLDDRVDVYADLELGAEHPRYVETVLHSAAPADASCPVWLRGPVAAAGSSPSAPSAPSPAALLAALVSPGEQGVQLVGGSDGDELTPVALRGHDGGPDTSSPATGLAALSEVEDVAVVAMPDSTYFRDERSAAEAVDALVAHCEAARFRFALIDPPENSTVSEVLAFRSRVDTAYAALYYPWLRVSDLIRTPGDGLPPSPLAVPPSGAVAGVFARSDREDGVHKAPASHLVRGITDLAAPVSAREQERLNPEGVNALRFVERRGNVVWGARTLSSDPEWKYVNIRRLLIYLEHSIEKSIRWAVFEPNDERLWVTIRSTVEDFLGSVWRSGALIGTTPDQAFFVRCGRTTMTQNDLDNGRLVCEVGIAPVHPAEFVIVRIGQWTADAQAPDRPNG